MEDVEKFLKELGVGQRPMNDPFFENTYKTCKVFERLGVTAEDEEELCHQVMKEFCCNACQAVFDNLHDYELHYHDTHHFVCSQCKKWKPTARLLEIHILEMHDSFFKTMAEKQPMYQCYVIDCEMKFQTPEDRTEHCRTIHKYPKNYRYDEVRPLKKVSERDPPMDVDEDKTRKKQTTKIHFGKNTKQRTFIKNAKTAPVSSASGSGTSSTVPTKPATMFVPRQVQQKSFAKVLTQNKQLEKNVLETESIMELGDSLPSLE